MRINRIMALNKNWTLSVLPGNPDVPQSIMGKVFDASVPGCVHTDLLNAGVIEDPYSFLVENKIQWIGRTNFKYFCEFEVSPGMLECDHLDLVFDGLDTIADICLNGVLIGQTANMFSRYRFDAVPHLKEGVNQLAITFYSPVNYCFEQQEKRGPLIDPGFGKAPCMFIRKMECNFGGDWAPNLPTCGIWQPVYLQAWTSARIDSVRPLTMSADSETASVSVGVDLVADERSSLELELILEGPDESTLRYAANVNADSVNVPLVVKNPQLWWPRGYGAQPLYTLTVALKDKKTGQRLDVRQMKTGLRQVRLNTEKDAVGSAFNIEINGRTVFCKGVNFIPDDFFVTRITEDDYRLRFKQMIEADINMVRIWGGGFYESDVFYNLADEYGVLVWQDFMCGGAALPEYDELMKLFEAEARHQLIRLSPHPSLVLWCGGNESIIFYFERWSGPENKKYDEFFDSPEDVIKNNLGQKPWGNGYYNGLFPRLAEELDPSRPYWPNSSYSGSMDINPLDENHGDLHIWKVCKKINYPNYRNYHPRFVSEFGFQSPATYATLAEVMPAEHLALDTPGMNQRHRYPRWFKNSCEHMLEHFEQPETFDAWVYLMQIHQARAIDCAAGWFRSQYPNCTGLLYWQFNDCWPVLSWSAVDGHNRKKPLYFATRRFFAERFMTIEPDGDTLAVFAHNDSDQTWRGDADLRRITLFGDVLARGTARFSLPPRSCQKIVVLDKHLTCPSDKNAECIYVSDGQVADVWFFEIDKNIRYPKPDVESRLQKTDSGYALTLTAKTLIRDIVLTPERLDPQATVSDGMVTLLPGECFTFTITSDKTFLPEDLCTPPVFWCANAFGKK